MGNLLDRIPLSAEYDALCDARNNGWLSVYGLDVDSDKHSMRRRKGDIISFSAASKFPIRARARARLEYVWGFECKYFVEELGTISEQSEYLEMV